MSISVNTQEQAIAIAEKMFFTRNNIDHSLIKDILVRINCRGIDLADIYFQHSRVESWRIEEGIIKDGSFSINQGVGLRAVCGEKSALAYSDDLSPAAMRHAADSVRAIGRTNQCSRYHSNKGIGIKEHRLYEFQNPQDTLTDAAKIALLQETEKYAFSQDPHITHVIASLASSYEVILIARHDGHMAADVRPLVRLSVQVMIERNGKKELAVSGGGGRYALADLTIEQMQHWVNEAIKEANHNLDAEPMTAGWNTVVLGPGWPGVLIHEAIGHGLESDFNRKKLSAFSGRIGEKVAHESITIVDNGTLPQRRGSLNIDDEGTPTQNTCLIENGILKGYLHDLTNARLMKMSPTGNGRRQSYAYLPMPRMTNTYMLNGECPPEEIIASVKDGIYVTNLAGGQVDITNGKFVFATSRSFRIQNGKITTPLKEATLIGHGPDVLTRVSMIGNDMSLDTGVGVCGKDGQQVPVGIGQPSLKIDGITVGGTT